MHSQNHRLFAGVARIDITPPVGVDLSGYVARMGPSIGVHDHLYARALVLDDGETQAALVVCDLVGFTSGFVTGARQAISTATGIPEAAMMIACTHTHSGPATLFLHECGTVDPAYLESVKAKLVEAVLQAAATPQQAEVGVGWGTLPEGLYNRRGDGSPVDASVGAAHLRAPSGESIAVLATYGCHPVVLCASNQLVSADYPGALVTALEDTLGGGAFFLTGACGNADPVRRGSFEDVEWLGEQLAEQVLAALQGMNYDRAPVLEVRRKLLGLPLEDTLTAETLNDDIAKQRGLLATADPLSAEAKVHRAMLAWAESTWVQVQEDAPLPAVDAEVQLLRIGPLAIVGVPGELFPILGREIQAGGSNLSTPVFVTGYANGDVGYVPDPAAYAAGGYEVNDAYKYYGYPAALSPEAGAALVAAAKSLLSSLQT
jgi:neutral ceramidase